MNLLRSIVLCVALVATALGQQVYYPLTVGNRLTFSGYGPWSQVTIQRDTLMPNGQRYAEFDGFQGYAPAFQRQQGSQVFQYNASANSDSLLFDFAPDAGDTLATYPWGDSDTLDIYLIQRDSVTVFGRRLRHWVFAYNIRKVIDDERVIDVVDSVGITELSLASGTSVIASATIDGTVYQTVSVLPDQSTVPQSIELHQNFPNPFNPSTTIRFSLPKKAVASLDVYDALGRMVRHYACRELPAGDHSVTVEAAGLASGLYLYRLVVGAESQVRRFVILK